MKGVLALFHQAALHAVGDIRQLDAAVADRAAAVLVEDAGLGPDLGADKHRLAEEQAFIATQVAKDLRVRRERGVALYQTSYGG